MRWKNWKILEQNDETVAKICDEYGVSDVCARLLINREVKDINNFINKNDLSSLYSPWLLTDMDKAVERIERALSGGENIAIYGDYDVDGVTSCALLYRYLKIRGANITYYIPDRTIEGYGVNMAAIKKLSDEGASLVITVDTGITATEEVIYARSIGLDIVITDHHECKGTLPDACAIVNPKRFECSYPFKELAGVGVVFKLICALYEKSGGDTADIVNEYADLVCLGTIADVMPLTGENRVISTLGLSRIMRTRNVGLKALMTLLKQDYKRPSSSIISYVLAPRINAAGRLGCASTAIELFLADDPDTARDYAQELCNKNLDRQAIENQIYNEACEMIEQEHKSGTDKVIILAKDNWHTGIIGIVASKLNDKYSVPCVLMSFSGDIGKGSGRSMSSFSLYDALAANSDLLVQYGGHSLAVGLTVYRENFEALKKALREYAELHTTLEEKVTTAECEIDDTLTIRHAEEIYRLEPYGLENPVPVFLIREAKISDCVPINDARNLKMSVTKGNLTVNTILFGVDNLGFEFINGDCLDILATVDVNNYRGKETLQLLIKDARICESSQRELERELYIYNSLMNDEGISEINREELAGAIPDRDDFAKIYRFIVRSDSDRINLPATSRRFKIENEPINYCKLRIAIEVFSELGVFNADIGEEFAVISKKSINEKIVLARSAILSRVRKHLLDS